MYELVPVFLLSTLVTWLVSLFTKGPKDVDSLFETMKR